MVRRHPHVFGENASGRAVPGEWERTKQGERLNRPRPAMDAGALGDVPRGLPALSRAAKIGARAARVGFDWPDLSGVLAKLREELDELEAELPPADAPDPAPEIAARTAARTADELGDVLFACANLARRLDLDPETCLRDATSKFERRFRLMERDLADAGRPIAEADFDQREAAWNRAKALDPDRLDPDRSDPARPVAGPGREQP
ncbi:MAG: nucleoside triphosphate pyrophosphohydrolase, partial [Gluconacetobacter diazotrophicus]|nr:nucleoside triphosphate pyrophosphohydrolase [Gluconacetobacter diazotrophicus]